MSVLGNLLWFFCGGFFSALGWFLAGILWSITIIGLPVGKQCFKFAALAAWPFGKEIVYGGGAGSLILNIIWMIITGIPMALESVILGRAVLHYHYRDTFRPAAFQNGQTGFDALWRADNLYIIYRGN